MQKNYKTQKRLTFSLLLLFMFYSGFSQNRTLSGRIMDETNAGLPGVNILVKGTNTGAVSDSQGNYVV